MANEEIPPSLAREGALMRNALARDLSDIPSVSLITTHDARLKPPPGVASVAVEPGRDPWRLWSYCAAKCQVAWVVGPETDGLLTRLNDLCIEADAMVIGPDAQAITIGSSKILTSDILIAAGVPALPTWKADDAPADRIGRFVAKPDDGAGCTDTVLIEGRIDRAALKPGTVLQPYAEGEAASLTVLRRNGVTTLLTANRQHVLIEQGVFRFGGVTLGGVSDRDGALAALADAVAKAIPGLDGIFGIDIVLTVNGPVVVEVNPRLTTSYAGLREAIGVNPATLVEPFADDAPRRTRNGAAQVEIVL